MATLPSGPCHLSHLDRSLVWVLSGGTVLNIPVGSTLSLDPVEVLSPQGARLLGMTPAVLADTLPEASAPEPEAEYRPVEVLDVNNIPYATEATFTSQPKETSGSQRAASRNYPFARGRGEVDGALACFDMLSQHFSMPFRKDVIQRILTTQNERMGQLSLPICGSISEMQGLKTQHPLPDSLAGQLCNRLRSLRKSLYLGRSRGGRYSPHPRELCRSLGRR